MEKIKVGDTLSLEVVNHKSFPGAINITSEGREVEGPFSVVIKMDASGHPEINLFSYIRDEEGRVIVEAEAEDQPEGVELAAKIVNRKFLFSGKLELKVDEEL